MFSRPQDVPDCVFTVAPNDQTGEVTNRLHAVEAYANLQISLLSAATNNFVVNGRQSRDQRHNESNDPDYLLLSSYCSDGCL